MRLKLKNTPEQVELVKAMGSKAQTEARAASEAFAAFIGPTVCELEGPIPILNISNILYIVIF